MENINHSKNAEGCREHRVLTPNDKFLTAKLFLPNIETMKNRGTQDAKVHAREVQRSMVVCSLSSKFICSRS